MITISSCISNDLMPASIVAAVVVELLVFVVVDRRKRTVMTLAAVVQRTHYSASVRINPFFHRMNSVRINVIRMSSIRINVIRMASVRINVIRMSSVRIHVIGMATRGVNPVSDVVLEVGEGVLGVDAVLPRLVVEHGVLLHVPVGPHRSTIIVSVSDLIG